MSKPQPSSRLRALLAFPNPVNEVAARLVAAGVVVMAAAVAALDQRWLLWPLALGFLARVASGPRFSPLALLVTRVVVPRLPFAARPVAGPPKRFAQGIGATLSAAALVLAYGVDEAGAARLLVGAIAVAAALEAALGFCVGCRIFAGLIRLRLVPDEVCAACADISPRRV